MTPYGYRIVNGEAVADPVEAEKLKEFFERFIAGGQIKPSAEEAGIMKTQPTCKRMLMNTVYLGTDYYPQIITKELFEAAQERIKEVSREKKGGRQIPTLPVYTGFMASSEAASPRHLDPKDYAIQQFERIKAVW
ncbi:MAG: recombinase [Blautia sp.]|nr:recombinase [Blautia sp.]